MGGKEAGLGLYLAVHTSQEIENTLWFQGRSKIGTQWKIPSPGNQSIHRKLNEKTFYYFN